MRTSQLAWPQWTPPTPAGIAFVGSDSASIPNGGGTTGSFNTTGANFVAVAVANVLGVPTLTDNKGNVYTKVVTTNYFTIDTVSLFVCENAVTGTGHTFTVANADVTQPMSLVMTAFSGVGNSGAFDQSATSVNTFVNSLTVGPITPTQSDELVLVAATFRSLQQYSSVDGGFALGDDITGAIIGVAVAYLIQTTAVAANPAVTVSGTTDVMTGVIASFRAQ